ncbi:FG-GAP repeat protein, partial [bacterium]|nr:FG-GAP repeat protein [bacterium]
MKKIAAILIFLMLLIFHQSAIGQSSRDVVQLFEAVGARAGSKLGYQVAGLGDQNGDGYDDILASAPGDRKAFLYFGGNPMDTIPDVIFHKENEDGFGYCLCNLGDVNGDFFNDFAIGSKNLVRVYWGGAELDTIADLFLPGAAGRDMCAAGDVNGDGYNDILISQVTWQSHQGKASLYFGGSDPDSIADWSAVGDSAWYYFGSGIAGNGDINGDGYHDIAISGWHQGEHRDYPFIKIFYGGAEMDTIPAFIIDSLADSLDIGLNAAFIDVDGDCFSDLCVDAAIETAALIFHGPIVPDIIAELVLHGTYLSGKMWEIAEAGDINDDGHPDIITGNYDGVGGLGEVLVFLGGPYMDGKWDILFSGFQGPYEGAGRSVGRAGDVNGDGVDDILFGAWRDYGDNKEGRVMIFSGDTSLTFISPDPPKASEPHSVFLKQNYPNPFNGSTVIEYEISVVSPT